jgi:putative ABC transport system permease protein
LQPGSTLRLDDQTLVVSGLFAAPGTVLESEIWSTLDDLRVAARRDTLSCLVLRLREADGFADVELFARQRLDLELSALRESEYYGRLADFFRPVRAMTWVTAGLIAVGALLGGFNTLHAAFASRVRELATLQAIGFRRSALLVSLVQESTLACLVGTLMAAGLAIVLLDGVTLSFSIGSFTMAADASAITTGLAAGLGLGLLGCVPPAFRCLRPPLPSALRFS